MLQIVRKKLTPADLTPPNIRFVDGDYQQTFDGGATWADAPALDPRTGDAYRAPALATDDPQCDAAANMVVALRQMVDALGHASSIVGIGSLLFGIFFFFVPFGWIADVILLVVEGIIVVGITPFVEAMTEDVYDQFLCIFYCNIDADGQMSQAQLDAIYVAVAAQFDTTIQGGFGSLSGGFGPVGWSNAGALGEIEDGDCSACDCVEPPELQIQIQDGIPRGQDLVMVDVGVWQCTSHDFSSENHWVLLETVDPDRKFQVIDITLISGLGGFPWYREFPLRGTGDYSQADPTGVPNINAVGQSSVESVPFTIQYTIINS